MHNIQCIKAIKAAPVRLSLLQDLVPKSSQNLVTISQRYYQPVLTSKASCVACEQCQKLASQSRD